MIGRGLNSWRRLLLAAVLACVVVAPIVASAAPATVQAVQSVGYTVSDLDRALDFYTGILGFTKTAETEVVGPEVEKLSGVFGARVRIARLRLGDETMELSQYLAPEGRPLPADFHANDRWFQHVAIIVSDMDRAYALLREHHVRHASTGPQTIPAWNRNAAGIRAFYFKDPDGHHLELLSFPAGKGDPRWQEKDRLFLGIDHTALVVADTEASLRFYRDLLGLRIVGEGENHGTEQEHLNNVFGARLRITTLAAAAGPKVELLEYLAPSGGRPYPTDAHANDLLHWQTRLIASDLTATERGVRAGDYPLISPGIVTVADTELRQRLELASGLNLRDPDGHAIALVTPAAQGAESAAAHP